MKKKVLIYSDCNLFGGSEHVIYNIIRNPYLKEKFSFSYTDIANYIKIK